MSNQHEHQWEIDYSQPVIDTLPEQYTWRCKCGAIGFGSIGEVEFKRMDSPKPTPDQP